MTDDGPRARTQCQNPLPRGWQQIFAELFTGYNSKTLALTSLSDSSLGWRDRMNQGEESKMGRADYLVEVGGKNDIQKD